MRIRFTAKCAGREAGAEEDWYDETQGQAFIAAGVAERIDKAEPEPEPDEPDEPELVANRSLDGPPMHRAIRGRRSGVVTALLLLGMLLGVAPAFAADRFSLLASAAQAASGNTPAFTLSTRTNCTVGVSVTAASGTTPTLDVRLEGSPDGGTTWYSLPADVAANSTATATAGAQVLMGASGSIDILDGIATIQNRVAYYRQIAVDKIRLRWFIGGTTPSFTFYADMVCK